MEKQTKVLGCVIAGILSVGFLPSLEKAWGNPVESQIAQQSPNLEEANRLLQEGRQLFREETAESLQQALIKFEQAATLFRQAENKVSEADALLGIGRVYFSLGERQQALDSYQRALKLFQAEDAPNGEATTLNHSGRVYFSLGEKEKALEYYQRALDIFQALDGRRRRHRRGEARTFNNLGRVYFSLGEKEKALEYYQRALKLFQSVDDPHGEARTLNNFGRVYSSLGKKEKALEYYQRALEIFQAEDNPVGQADTLNNFGQVYNSRGEKKKALDYYQRALNLSQAADAPSAKARTLNNFGRLYNSLGEKQQALDRYQRALTLFQALSDPSGEATTLNNLGRVYNSFGEKQQALEHYQRALSLFQTLRDPSGEATTLKNLGRVYDDLGEMKQALDYYQRALSLFQALRDPYGKARTLNNLGGVYNFRGEKEKALDYYQLALPLFEDLRDPDGEAHTLNNLGRVYNSRGEKEKALDHYQRALPLFEDLRDPYGKARTLNNLGRIYNSRGEKEKALDYYQDALPLFQALSDRAGVAFSFYNIASLQRSQGNLETALTQIEKAIAILEKLRTNIDSKDLRTSYFASIQDYYQFYLDLLMELHRQNPDRGYDARAFHVSERSRARSLIELLTEADINFREGLDNPTAQSLLDREQNLEAKLEAQQVILAQRLSNTEDETEREAAKKDYLTTTQDLESQLESVINQLKRQSPAYTDLKYPEPLTLSQVQQQVLDSDTILLQYALSDKQSYLWLVTKDGYQTYTLPPKAEIEKTAETFVQIIERSSDCQTAGDPQACQRRNQELILPHGQTLYQQILAPVSDRIAGKRLLIVGDGQLHYTPFAALPIPSSDYQPFLTQHEIVTAPSATTIATQRRRWRSRPPAPKDLAILADPVFTAEDDRITAKSTASTIRRDFNIDRAALLRSNCISDQSIQRLPGTRQGTEAIQQYFPEQSIVSALDFAANQDWFNNTPLDQYRHLFLATHGCLDQQNPELSGLILTLVNERGQEKDDGFLRLNEIFNLNLAADLVVLSACSTGKGEEIKGEGIVGMTQGFMYAGAERIVVSLWDVNDRATADLMSQFYESMMQEQMTPASALHQAQLAMWEKYQDPRLWAAFTLQGEWRD